MKQILSTLFFVLAMVGGFALAASVAYAGTGVSGGESETLSELLRMIADAFTSGNPTLGGVLVVVAGVTGVRKYGALKFPWLAKPPWPALLVLIMSFGSTVAAMLTAGSALTAALWPAAKLAIGAGGIYALVSHLGGWALSKWGDKMPSWLRAALSAALWMFKSLEPRLAPRCGCSRNRARTRSRRLKPKAKTRSRRPETNREPAKSKIFRRSF
jgi:hypothetical protein